MSTEIMSSISGLTAFLSYFAVSVILLLVFSVVYTALTRHHEWALIRANNASAAVAFSGSVIGFCLPLASAISHSASLVDCAIWGMVALIVQLLTYEALTLVQRDLSERITRGELAFGIWLAGMSLAVGMLNAACMTW